MDTSTSQKITLPDPEQEKYNIPASIDDLGLSKEDVGNDIKVMKGVHRIIQDLDLSGASVEEIARVVGYTTVQIRNIRRSQLYQAGFQQKSAERSKEIHNLINGVALESVVTIRDLQRHSNNSRIKFTAAKWLAETAGYKPVEKKEIRVDVADTVARAMEIAEARRNGVPVPEYNSAPIDAEFEEMKDEIRDPLDVLNDLAMEMSNESK